MEKYIKPETEVTRTQVESLLQSISQGGGPNPPEAEGKEYSDPDEGTWEE